MAKEQPTHLVVKIFPSSPTGVWFSRRFSHWLAGRVYYREFRFSFPKAVACGAFVVLLAAWAVIALGLNYTSRLEAARHRERSQEAMRSLVQAKRDFVTLYARMRPLDQRLDQMDQLARKLSILLGADPARIPAFQKTEAPSPDEIQRIAEILYARFDEFHSLATDKQWEMDHLPSISPLRDAFVVTDRFGHRRNRFLHQVSAGGPDADYPTSLHTAIDLAAPIGTPVYATADAVVHFAGSIPREKSARGSRYGLFLTLDHQNGIRTYFAHCDRLNVAEGAKVRRGDLVAWVGNTGRSTGPHLHYEVVVGKTPVNPEWYISDRDLLDPSSSLESVDLSQTSELGEELSGVVR